MQKYKGYKLQQVDDSYAICELPLYFWLHENKQS